MVGEGVNRGVVVVVVVVAVMGVLKIPPLSVAVVVLAILLLNMAVGLFSRRPLGEEEEEEEVGEDGVVSFGIERPDELFPGWIFAFRSAASPSSIEEVRLPERWI